MSFFSNGQYLATLNQVHIIHILSSYHFIYEVSDLHTMALRNANNNHATIETLLYHLATCMHKSIATHNTCITQIKLYVKDIIVI